MYVCVCIPSPIHYYTSYTLKSRAARRKIMLPDQPPAADLAAEGEPWSYRCPNLAV